MNNTSHKSLRGSIPNCFENSSSCGIGRFARYFWEIGVFRRSSSRMPTNMVVSPGTSPLNAGSTSAPGVVRLQAASVSTTAIVTKSFFIRSEEHTSELQSHVNLVCRLLLEKKKKRVVA